MEKIKLTEKEVESLNDFVKKKDEKTEMEIKDTLWISRATVSNIKKDIVKKDFKVPLQRNQDLVSQKIHRKA